MSSKQQAKATSRRKFFKLAGLGAGAVAAVAVSKSATAASETEAKRGSAGYRETDHVKKFYETAKF